jgi:hypothetical protein
MSDVMKDLQKGDTTAKQSVPKEEGNNAGPGMTEGPLSTSKGDIDIKGTPDFMGATPDAAK